MDDSGSTLCVYGSLRLAARAGGVVSTCAALMFATFAVTTDDPDVSMLLAAMCVVCLAGTAVVGFEHIQIRRTPGPLLAVDDSGITVRSGVRGLFIPWSALHRLVVKSINGVENALVIELRNRAACSVPPGSKLALVGPKNDQLGIGRSRLPCRISELAKAVLARRPQ